MNFYLVVKTPFANYVHGQHITDSATIEALETSEQIHFCVRIAAPTVAEPAGE